MEKGNEFDTKFIRYLIILFIVCGITTNVYSSKHPEQNIINRWVGELIELNKNTVGYSPPVTARAFAYFSIAIYYAMNCNDQSAMKKLYSLDSNFVTIEGNLDKEYLINEVAYKIILRLYPQATEYNLKILKECNENYSIEDYKDIQNIALKICDIVYRFSLEDGGMNGYLQNFPSTYIPPSCDSCWTRTPPGFLPSQLPYWGKNKVLVQANYKASIVEQPMIFSIDSNSEIFRESMKLYLNQKNISKEEEIIAEYWDDAPGYSGTPPAHIFNTASILTEKYNVDLSTTAEMFLLLGIAINDAFIITWKMKYTYNTIRPITYIHRFIAKDYSTLIMTPPFPEFPSGHSCQSSAGIKILEYYFPYAKNIKDDTHKNRVDIYGKPRKYKTLEDMNQEVSISRFYGGIHYRNTLEKSIHIGSIIGETTYNFFKGEN